MLVVLDRDGVLNHPVAGKKGPRPPWSIGELEVVAGAREAVQLLVDAGAVVVVATNQPDVARGDISRETVDAINAEIQAQVGNISKFYVCDHDNDDNCDCRKPKPGMLLQAQRDFDANVDDCWMVGDRWTDIAAGEAAGFKTVLVGDVVDFRPTSAGAVPEDLSPDFTAKSLSGAVRRIVSGEKEAPE